MMKGNDDEVDVTASTKSSKKSDTSNTTKNHHHDRKKRESSTSQTSYSTKASSQKSSAAPSSKASKPPQKVVTAVPSSKKHKKKKAEVVVVRDAKVSAKKDEKTFDATKKGCLSVGFMIQNLIFIVNFLALAIAVFYIENDALINSFGTLAFIEFELLIVMLFGVCITCCSWFSVINIVVILLLEFSNAIYMMVMDLNDECHDNGCTYLTGQFLHRIFFIALCFIFGSLHAIMAVSIPATLCLSTSNDSNVAVVPVVATRKKIHPKRRRVSTSRARSQRRSRPQRDLSTSISRTTKSDKRYSTTVTATPSRGSSSFQTLESKYSTYPSSAGSQKLSSTTSSAYPYTGAYLTQAEQQRYQQQQQQYYQQQAYPYSSAAATPYPYQYGQHYPGGQMPSSDTVMVQYPSPSAPQDYYRNVTVNVPYPPAYPQQQPGYHPTAQIQLHQYRYPPEYYQNPTPAAPTYPKQAVLNAKTSQKDSDDSYFTISQTSENHSLVLPNSFASKDTVINGSQGIFTANTPPKKKSNKN